MRNIGDEEGIMGMIKEKMVSLEPNIKYYFQKYRVIITRAEKYKAFPTDSQADFQLILI